MTQEQLDLATIEFLKIIIDRGLLAIILVVVAYFFNKAIETYKSELSLRIETYKSEQNQRIEIYRSEQNRRIEAYKSELNKAIEDFRAKAIYFQKLSDYRIQAYLEISQVLGIHMSNILHIINMAAPSAMDKSPDRDNEVRKLLDAYGNFHATDIDLNPVIGKHIILVSQAFKMLPEYQKQVLRFHKILQEIEQSDYPSEGWQKYDEHKAKLQDIKNSLEKSLASLRYTLSQEIYTFPTLFSEFEEQSEPNHHEIDHLTM